MNGLNDAQAHVLRSIANGATLKSHRDIDGQKIYRLHPLTGTPEPVSLATMDALRKRKFLDSNKKFPAATYLLTEKGRRVAASLDDVDALPLTARNY